MSPIQKSRTPPPPGDVPYRRLYLGSEVAEACTEGIVVVSICIRRCSEVREAFGIRLRHRSEAGEAVFIRRRHRSEAGEAAEGWHRHHSEAAGKGRLHRAEIGVLHVESIEAGIHDFDRYFRFGFDRDGLGFHFTGFTLSLALGASFSGREFNRGVFFCHCCFLNHPGDGGLSREELYGPQNTNRQHGQEEGDISRNCDQRISCLCNSNSVCRDILNSLLTASVYLCFDSLASVSNNVAEKSFIVPDGIIFGQYFFENDAPIF